MSGFPAGVDNLTNPIPTDPFSSSNGLPSTQYFIRANAALVALENVALQRTSGKVVVADGFTTQAEVLLSDAESLTNWAGTGIHDAAVLDTTYFTRSTHSIHVSLNETTAGAKYCYNLPSPVAVGAHLFAAIDLRWQHIGGAGGDPSFYSAVIATGANLTGTTSVVALGQRPQGVFSTVIIPVGAVGTIASIGILATSVSAVAPPAWTHFWLDNAVLKAQSSLETALGSGTQMAVIVPASVTPDTKPHLLDPTETILDLRPGSAVLGGHAGTRYAREFGIPEDGSREVSTEINTVFNSLPAGSKLQLSAKGKYLCNGQLTLALVGGRLDGNGATIFSNVQRTANLAAGEVDHFVDVAADATTVERLRIVGYRSDTYLGSALVTTAGTPTISGSTMLLDSLNEAVRIPKQPLDGGANLETPYYFRDKDGNLTFEVVVSDNNHVANDCVLEVVDDDFGTSAGSIVIPLLSPTPTKYTLSFRGDRWVDNRLQVRVRKSTGLGNTITVTSVTAYNTCGYRQASELSSGINVSTGSSVTIANCEIEGPDGDGVTVDDPTARHVTVRNTKVRGAGRHGFNVNCGTDVVGSNLTARESGRCGFSIDPQVAGQATLRTFLRNCHSYNAREWAVGAINWARNTYLVLQNIESDGAGLGFLWGGSNYGSVNKITHRVTYRLRADRIANGGVASADFIYVGTNSHCASIVTDLGIMFPALGAAGGNSLGTFKITAAPDDSGSLILDAPHSSLLSGGTAIDTQGSPITWGAGAFIGQARMAADAKYAALDFGVLRSRYPKTYKGLAYSEIWMPGGYNVLDEPIYNARGISGGTVKPNNFGQITLAVAPGATFLDVVFPTQAMATFASIDTPTASTGGTLAAATYRYRVAPRGIYGGPGPALAETAGVVISGGNNAVLLGIRRWAVDGDAQIAGCTIWRGTSAGVYTRRYDVSPNARFYAIQQDVAVFKDLGTTLVPPAASNFTWGYPASVAASAGSLVPADESGFEPDVGYGVAVETSWPTSKGVPAANKTPGGFRVTFGAAATGGSPTLSYFIWRT